MEEAKYIPGDLVKIKYSVFGEKCDEVFQVVLSSLKKDTYILRNDRNKITSFPVRKEQINPIPLTSAILEANGWKYKRESGIDTYTFGEDISNSIIIEVSRDKEFCLSVSDSTCINLKIEYIHQLQHLLFGLGLDSSLNV